MSLFFDYFRKTLRWIPVWNPGPLSAIAKGGAFALDQARTAILWVRDQFIPERCHEEYIKRHAAARVISNKHYRETPGQYRSRVVHAYDWHLKGGIVRGLVQILEHYGFEHVVVYNLRQEDPARWAEFRIYVRPAFWMETEDYQLLEFLCNEFKPARSRLETIVVQIEASQNAYHGIEVVTATHQRVEFT